MQETWLAARRVPPDPERPARPWLASVLRNLVHARWQSERRRRRREQAQAVLLPDRAAAVDTLYERVEMQRLVAQRVMALGEPLRTVLLLRYFEGHDSTRIAAILGLPAGTVRWRLKTAIDRLRADMDARFGGDRQAWALVLAPTAAPIPAAGSPSSATSPPSHAQHTQARASAVRAQPARMVGAPVVGSAVSSALLGTAATVCLALAGGVALGLGVGTWSGARGHTSGERASAKITGAASLRAADRTGVRLGGDLPRLQVTAPVDAIAGTVLASGEPEDDAVVVATAMDAEADPATIAGSGAHLPRTKSADGGRFLLSALPPGRYRLTASGHTGGIAISTEIDLPAGRAIEGVVLELAGAGAGVAGRVLDSTGEGIPRARVRARLEQPPPAPPLVFETESGCLGRYHLDLEAGLYGFENRGRRLRIHAVQPHGARARIATPAPVPNRSPTNPRTEPP